MRFHSRCSIAQCLPTGCHIHVNIWLNLDGGWVMQGAVVKAAAWSTMASSFLAAGNACAATEVMQQAASDGRANLLLTLPAIAIGWVRLLHVPAPLRPASGHLECRSFWPNPAALLSLSAWTQHCNVTEGFHERGQPLKMNCDSVEEFAYPASLQAKPWFSTAAVRQPAIFSKHTYEQILVMC